MGEGPPVTGARVFDAIARGTAEATGAAAVAVIARHDEDLRVVGAAGTDGVRTVGDDVAPGDESVGFVLASGQTLSLGPQTEKPGGSGMVHRTPGAILSVPCLGGEGVLGLIEVRGQPGLQPFPPEATRMATLFAEIAAAMLEEAGDGAQETPGAAELGAELGRLADADPARYAAIASVIGALLAHG
jgi:GAF domain-containing protein